MHRTMTRAARRQTTMKRTMERTIVAVRKSSATTPCYLKIEQRNAKQSNEIVHAMILGFKIRQSENCCVKMIELVVICSIVIARDLCD